MGRRIGVRPRLIRGAALAFAGLTAACAHVGQEQFDTELAALRAEIEEATGNSNRRTEAQFAQLEAGSTDSPEAFPSWSGSSTSRFNDSKRRFASTCRCISRSTRRTCDPKIFRCSTDSRALWPSFTRMPS